MDNVKRIIIEDYSGDKVEVVDGYDYERKLKQKAWNDLMKDKDYKQIKKEQKAEIRKLRKLYPEKFNNRFC